MGRDWLEILCRGLDRVGAGLIAARASGGDVELRFQRDRRGQRDDGAWEELRVLLSRDLSRPISAEVQGIGVSARGRTSAEDLRTLSMVARLIDRLAPRIPPDLSSSTLRLGDEMPPHRALAFAFPFCTAERSLTESGAPRVEEVLLRLTGRCNQACPFCSAPPRRADPTEAELAIFFQHLDRLAPEATLTFTGGEPTLRADLPELVERALRQSGGRRLVEVQTNAVRLAAPELVDAFPTSSRLRFFVSLHSFDSERYDRCTGTRGQLPRAVAGLRNLLERRHEVIVSCVVGAVNHDRLVELVEGIAGLGRGGPLPSIHFSVLMCPEHRPGAVDHLIRYTELAPTLQEAFTRAEQAGLHPEPLLSSSHAAIPPCVLQERFRVRFGPPPVLEALEPGAKERVRGWVQAQQCQGCRYRITCPGVPRGYAERFGLADFRPVT